MTIRSSLGAVVILMGLLGLGLALATGSFYRELVFEHHKRDLARIGMIKVNDVLRDLETRMRDLGLALQHSPAFRAAYTTRDHTALTVQLRNQFHQYFVTAGVLQLEGLRVRDADLVALVAVSDEGSDATPPDFPDFIQQAAERRRAERLKPIAQLCSQDGRPYFTLLAPIGGLRVSGYVEVITDPVFALRAIEDALELPVRISAGKKILHTSPGWGDVKGDMLVVRLMPPDADADDTDGLIIEMKSSTELLAAELERTRYLVMAVAGIVTTVVIAIVLSFFNLRVLAPLEKLAMHMRVVRQDRSRLGEPVKLGAKAEVEELAITFNELTAELNVLHQQLEKLAFSDALTGLPNRLVFQDLLEQQVRLCKREGNGFALLAIDLNRFKEINDSVGHAAGDALLQKMSERMKAALRQCDTIALQPKMLARLGGDEFCVILPSVDNPADAETVARKLLAVVDTPFILEEQPLRVGISIGIALFPTDAVTVDQLCRKADRAMYYAKRRHLGFAHSDSVEEPAPPVGLA